MGPLKFAGLALATSLAAIVNFSLLYFYSHKKARAPDRFGLAKYALTILIAAFLSGAGAHAVTRLFMGSNGFGGTKSSALAIIFSAAAFFIIYFAVCKLLKIEELGHLTALLKRQK
jgi:peptidoglycan biosynthesis protein MviN/MurJ (putative lipid II flippase)